MKVQRYVYALFGGFRSVCWTMNGWSIEGTASSESFIWTSKTNSLRFATLLCTSALWSESLKESRSPQRFTNKCFEVSFDSVQVNALIFPPKKWFGNRSDRIAHERRILLEVTTWCFWLNSTAFTTLEMQYFVCWSRLSYDERCFSAHLRCRFTSVTWSTYCRQTSTTLCTPPTPGSTPSSCSVISTRSSGKACLNIHSMEHLEADNDCYRHDPCVIRHKI